MRGCRIAAVCLLAWTVAASAPAQDAQHADQPKPFQPIRPTTREEIDQRDALHLYVFGLLCEKDERLLEALKAFEDSARLNPRAAAPLKAQIPLLLAMERPGDSLAAAKKAVELEPDDHEAWFAVARLQKTLGNFKESRQALESGLARKEMKENHPEVAQQMLLDLGHLLELEMEWDAAVAALTEAAQILDRPDMLLDHGNFSREAIVARSGETHERIGNLLRKANKPEKAIAAYREAIKRSPESAGRLHYRLAQLAGEQGRSEEALAYLDNYLRQRPIGVEPYDLKIELLRKLKRSGDIVPWLEQTVGADPHNQTLKMTLAKQYAEAGRTDAAEKTYRALADQTPSEDLYRDLFRIYKGQGTGSFRTLTLVNQTLAKANDKAEPPGTRLAAQQAKAMIDALREDGELAKDLVRVGFWQIDREQDIRFETLHLLAALADKHRKLDEAEKFYRKALQQPNVNSEAILYGGLLRTLWKAKKYDEILRVCKEGLAKSKGTNRLLFYNDMAKVYSHQNRHNDALAQADIALKQAGDKDRFNVRHLRVRLLMRAEKFDLAEAECKDMFKEFAGPGDDLEVRYLLSNVYSAMKKPAQSEEQLIEILKIDPGNVSANNDLGYSWADKGKNLKEAEEMIRRALDLDKKQRRMVSADEDQDNAAYVDSLGWVLFRQGKLDEAKKELERAVKLQDGDDPVLWDHLGDVCFRVGNVDQAQAAWERAIRLFEEEGRRKKDERYDEIRRKLQQAKQRVQGN